MKKQIATTAMLAAAIFFACRQPSTTVATGNATVTNEQMVTRGKYLVDIMGCNDCHSPKVMTAFGPAPDTSRLLSGHPSQMPLASADTNALKSWVLFSNMLTSAAGPWGVSFAANLTSDETGIGTWTEQQFIKCIREGKLKGLDGSRNLLPPMPWQGFAKATDDDLKAIFAYLKSTKPVHNVVPPPIPPKRA